MKEIFKAHRNLSEQDYSDLWNNALFIFDTNVLLHLYRLPESARNDFLNILSNEKIKTRIWLPFQVILEFTHNRLETIGDQKNKFFAVEEIINSTLDEIQKTTDFLSTKLNELQLKKRHSVIDPEKLLSEEIFKEPKLSLLNFLAELRDLDAKQPDVNDEDAIKNKIFDLFTDKIGKGLSLDELKKLYDEGESRYKENIPPGFKDKDKPGFYLFEDKKYIRKYGDLIAWREIINKASDEKLKHIIFITNDGKEDWWQVKRGKILGPRYELLNEIYFNADELKIFHMYDSYGFMKYSSQYLQINVKEQSLTESKDLIELHQTSQKGLENDVINVIEYFRQYSQYFGISLKFSNLFVPIQIASIPINTIKAVLTEIFENIKIHSYEKTARIIFRHEDDYYVIRFSNYVLGSQKSQSTREEGINHIRILMREYGDVDYSFAGNVFKLELFIKKEFIKFPHIENESE